MRERKPIHHLCKRKGESIQFVQERTNMTKERAMRRQAQKREERREKNNNNKNEIVMWRE